MHECARISEYLYAVADHFWDFVTKIGLEYKLSFLPAFFVEYISEEWYFRLLKIKVFRPILGLTY